MVWTWMEQEAVKSKCLGASFWGRKKVHVE